MSLLILVERFAARKNLEAKKFRASVNLAYERDCARTSTRPRTRVNFAKWPRLVHLFLVARSREYWWGESLAEGDRSGRREERREKRKEERHVLRASDVCAARCSAVQRGAARCSAAHRAAMCARVMRMHSDAARREGRRRRMRRKSGEESQ